MVESVGNLNYNAATFQLAKRFSKGYQFSVNYTLSRSTDDAPEQNLVAAPSLALEAPENRAFDQGRSLADQTHTFVMSFVGRPQFNFENKALKYVLNNNLFGIIATANNGEVFNSITNQDLNGDGVFVDRAVGIERNFGRTPRQFNVDLRYSRFIPLTERFRLELFAEATNIFNINSIYQFNNTTLTNGFDILTGNLTAPLPDYRLRGVTSLDSRQIQLGIKFNF